MQRGQDHAARGRHSLEARHQQVGCVAVQAAGGLVLQENHMARPTVSILQSRLAISRSAV